MEEKKIIELAGDFSQKPDMAAITKITPIKDGDKVILHFDVIKYDLDIDTVAEQFKLWQQCFPHNDVIGDLCNTGIEVKEQT